MRIKKSYYNFISLISLLLLFFFSFLIYKFYLNSDPTIINFNNNELSSDFEMEITNNLENLDNFFDNFTFIKSYLTIFQFKGERNLKKEIQNFYATLTVEYFKCVRQTL